MVDSNEKQQINILTSEEKHSESPVENKNKPQSFNSCINKVTLLISFVALAFAGYSYWSNHQLRTNLVQENNELSTQFQQLKTEQNSLQHELNKQTSELGNNQQEFTKKIGAFAKEVQIIRQKDNQGQDWLLLKARYYVELAQINAHWINNSEDQSTEALLEQADTILGQMKTAELFKIRQIIAKEVLQLKSANHLDIPGLLSQFDAIQTNIGKLQLQQTLSLKADLADTINEKPAPAVTTGFSWKTQFNNSIDMLGKLVVVRRSDEEIKPLLSPVFESLLKESLRLNIQEAQWALLNRNSLAYQLALKQATATLQRGFNKQLANTSTLIEQLKDLEKINLVAEKIEVGQALPLLNELIEQRLITPSETTNKTGGQE